MFFSEGGFIMSRSYKKFPICKGSPSKNMKRFANKKVRHAKDLPKKGKAYKKCFESYDISDWCWIWTKEEAIHEYLTAEPDSWIRKLYKTLEDYLKYWEKCVKRK